MLQKMIKDQITHAATIGEYTVKTFTINEVAGKITFRGFSEIF